MCADAGPELTRWTRCTEYTHTTRAPVCEQNAHRHQPSKGNSSRLAKANFCISYALLALGKSEFATSTQVHGLQAVDRVGVELRKVIITEIIV